MMNKSPRRLRDGARKDASPVATPVSAHNWAKATAVAEQPSKPRRTPLQANGYERITGLEVSGATAPDGTPWIHLRADDIRSTWVPLSEFADQAAGAKSRLAAANLHLFKEDLTRVLDDARSVTAFPSLPLIEKPGWSGPYFALLSGTVFAPEGSPTPIVLFEPDRFKCASAGDKSWFRGVSGLAAGQPMLTFVVMLGFAGPLLSLSRVQENVGFELCGRKGRGKTTLQYLAASVTGPALQPQGRNYWINANTTINALEAQVPVHNDMLLVIEEMSAMYAGESEKVRANRMRELIFRMAGGTAKARHQGERQVISRFIWLTSTNDATAKLLKTVLNEAAEAAVDRLLALPISGQSRGVFVKPFPDGCATGDEAVRKIIALVSQHYGRPIRLFLKRLVKARATDEAALRMEIEARIVEFRAAVGISGNAGSEARVADAFGLIYSAGVLAQKYGALPATLDCMEAARFCHRLNRNSAKPDLTNIARAHRLAAHPKTLTVDMANMTAAYRKRLSTAPALLMMRRDGRRELVLTDRMLMAAFKARKAVLSDPAIRRRLRHDDGRTSVKLKLIHDGRMERVTCIRPASKRSAC
jgi:hypothetical protein